MPQPKLSSQPSISRFAFPRPTVHIQRPLRYRHVPTPIYGIPTLSTFFSLSLSRENGVWKSQRTEWENREKFEKTTAINRTTMATIKVVKARQIFDSRGNPTVEVSFTWFFIFLFLFLVSVWLLRKKWKESGKKKKKTHTLFSVLGRERALWLFMRSFDF